MTILTCAAVRRHLAAFYDHELPIPQQIAVELHLEGCVACAHQARQFQVIGEAVRARLAPRSSQAGDLAGLQVSVVSRMKAERDESLPMRVRRMFEDLHLLWAALGATMATVTSVAIVVGVLHSATDERADSLAAILTAMASPGSNENPVRLDGRIRLPRALSDDVMPAVLFGTTPKQEDAVLALSAVVTREGRVIDLEVLLDNEQDRHVVLSLLNAASAARFEPAQFDGSPVAVNMVWLLAHTTVRGKLHSS